MKLKIKANKFVVIALFFVCIVFILSPAIYAASCLNAISVWGLKVLPTLLPFFIITRIIVNTITPKPNALDKLFNKVYHTPALTSIIYVLSIISGYPMGAKLICNAYDNNYVNKQDAKRMLSFCSISGPMFIVGTVGVSIFLSYKIGVVILISNIIASLINGLIYRGKPNKICDVQTKPIAQKNVLEDSVYDALISVIMVGGYIVLSFLVIDLLKNLGAIQFLSKLISTPLKINSAVVEAVLCGIVEITRGVIELQASGAGEICKTILASGLIGFGGISVIMQSASFLSRLQIKASTMIKQKITQGLLCLVVTSIFAVLIL